jgi:hypothetical protein
MADQRMPSCEGPRYRASGLSSGSAVNVMNQERVAARNTTRVLKRARTDGKESLRKMDTKPMILIAMAIFAGCQSIQVRLQSWKDHMERTLSASPPSSKGRYAIRTKSRLNVPPRTPMPPLESEI